MYGNVNHCLLHRSVPYVVNDFDDFRSSLKMLLWVIDALQAPSALWLFMSSEVHVVFTALHVLQGHDPIDLVLSPDQCTRSPITQVARCCFVFFDAPRPGVAPRKSNGNMCPVHRGHKTQIMVREFSRHAVQFGYACCSMGCLLCPGNRHDNVIDRSQRQHDR